MKAATVQAFEVPHHAAIAANPGENPFYVPAFGRDDKAMEIEKLDDLDLSTPRRGDGRHFSPG